MSWKNTVDQSSVTRTVRTCSTMVIAVFLRARYEWVSWRAIRLKSSFDTMRPLVRNGFKASFTFYMATNSNCERALSTKRKLSLTADYSLPTLATSVLTERRCRPCSESTSACAEDTADEGEPAGRRSKKSSSFCGVVAPASS